MRYSRRLSFPLVALAAAAALAGCKSTNLLEEDQITTTNIPDMFSWSVTGLDNVSDIESYLWTVSGTRVTVDVTQSIGSGGAFMQIRDGAGTVVYAEDIIDEVDGVTDDGVLGSWQVDIVLERVDGSFSVALQRDTLP